MAIQLDVVGTDPHQTTSQRQDQTVRAIAEILPFVLGKYGIGQQSVGSRTVRGDGSPRFRVC